MDSSLSFEGNVGAKGHSFDGSGRSKRLMRQLMMVIYRFYIFEAMEYIPR
jgi:hypothetical protein